MSKENKTDVAAEFDPAWLTPEAWEVDDDATFAETKKKCGADCKCDDCKKETGDASAAS